MILIYVQIANKQISNFKVQMHDKKRNLKFEKH